jgi:hypothetical protein
MNGDNKSNDGYARLPENRFPETSHEPSIDPQLERVVGRAIKRCEDDYLATNQATWTPPDHPLLDRFLNQLELRISRLEDALEAAVDANEALMKSEESTAYLIPSRPAKQLNIEEIKRQASSIQLSESILSTLASASVAELIAKLGEF